MPEITKFIESPYTALLVAVVFGALALSGKFNVTATQFLLVLAWLIAVVGLRDQPSPLLIGAAAIIGGALLLLGYYFRPEVIPTYTGVLVPKSETLLSFKDKIGSRKLEIGDSGTIFIFDGPEGGPLFNFFGEHNLTVERVDKRIKVSTQIQNEEGHLVAELIRNEWKVAPPPKTFDRNYTDDALEVRDEKGRVVLQVRALLDRIQIQGEWRSSRGDGWRLLKNPSPQGGALLIPLAPGIVGEPPIQAMFEYPSESHLGQLKHSR